MINPYTVDYVKHHQQHLRHDATAHRTRRNGHARSSPHRSAPRAYMARLLMSLGARLTPNDAGFVVGSRVIVLPEPSCDDGRLITAA